MIRFDLSTRLPMALMLIAISSGTLTAGVFDVFKASDKAPAKKTVVRAQEPNPAPPAPLDVGSDPAYAQPLQPTPSMPAPVAAMPAFMDPTMDCAPQYSGFSGSACCHACIGCREPQTCCEHCNRKMVKCTRKLHGQSFYCDCYPLCGPRYGYYTTCWRRLPEDCRCPILLPPRKSKTISSPIPTDGTTPPADSQLPPPPPQALNFR